MIWMFGKGGKKSRLSKISKEFTQQIGRIATQKAKGRRNEEETRRWCVDLLRSALGYKDHDIETELSILGQRVDIALKDNDRVFMVIECKAATVALSGAAINQAANYATSLGAEWAVVTNGDNWKLLHVSPSRGSEPELTLVFDVSILDEDGLSSADAECLYLLTKEAVRSGEAKLALHRARCLSIDVLRAALISGPTVAMLAKRMEAEYKSATGVAVSLSEEEVSGALEWMLEVAEVAQES